MSGGLVKLVRSAGIPRGMLTAAQGAFRYLKRPHLMETDRFYKLAYLLQDRKNWLSIASGYLQLLMGKCPDLKERLSLINKKIFSVDKIMGEAFKAVNKKFDGQLGNISLKCIQKLGKEETLKSLSLFKSRHRTMIYEIREKVSKIRGSFKEIKNELSRRGHGEEIKVIEDNLENFERLINNQMELKALGITFDLEELMGEVED